MISQTSLKQNKVGTPDYYKNPAGTVLLDRVGGVSGRSRTLRLIKYVSFTVVVDAPSGSPVTVNQTIQHDYGRKPLIQIGVSVDGEEVIMPANIANSGLVFSNARNITATSFDIEVVNSTAFSYILPCRAYIFDTTLLN